MSQTWTDDTFAGSHDAQTDLQNMENNLACLKSLFSGTTAPSNTLAGMPWFDTTKKVLKMRDSTDAAWIGLMHGDTSQKMWVYRNAAMDGWTVDSGVSDVVLALKGGTTYTAGAATAGSWTVSGLAHTHAQTAHTHDLPLGPGPDTLAWKSTQKCGSGDLATDYALGSAAPNGGSWYDHFVSDASAAVNTGSGGASDATWRAAAAVGTLQYLGL